MREVVGKLQKFTMVTKIYNVFFFLQLFNEINCRKVGNKDFDVFESTITPLVGLSMR